MRPPLELTVSPSAEFDTDCCEVMNQALHSNKKEILALARPPQTPTTKIVSHHIKVTDPSIRYLDVLFDQTTQQYSILVKKSDRQKFEGFHKNVCTQFLISLSHSTQQQTITPVVSIKAKDDYHEDIVTHEIAEEDGLVFTCVSSNTPNAKRINKKRAIQVDLGPPLASQLEAITQLDKPAALSTVCGLMVQVGTQIAYYNLIKRKTHFDLHTGNILCKTQPLSETQSIENFTIIDYPNNHLTCQGGVDTEPSKLFYYDDLNQKIDVGYGVATPIISSWPDMFGWNELETLLKFLDLDEATIIKFNNIALTGEGEKYKIHGFTADSFGYLRSLYALIKDSKELTVLFKPFLKQQLLDLLQTSHSMPQKLPKYLTSLGLLQNFIAYCTTHSELNNHISTQLALPATTGWQENTKTLLSTSIDTPNTKPITTRKNQKPSSSETFQHYINTLSQESTQLASQYFLDTQAMPMAQKITDLYTFMEQISEQITAYHTQHNATHFHILTSQVTTHLADDPDRGKVRKFTLLTPSYLNQVNATHLAPKALYDYDAVHKKADQQWGISSPFIKPWPHMDGWHELQSLLSFIQVDTATAKKFGNISLTNEGEEYQTCGYAIDSYGYLYSLYTLIKDDPALSKAFRPFLQKQMLDVITTSHKHPTNWPKSLMPQGIVQQFTQYCLNHSIPIGQKAAVTQKKKDTAKNSPITLSIPPERPATTNKELLQQLKNGVSLYVKIDFFTLVYDFIVWLFTGKKTTLSLKKLLLSQLSELQKNDLTPSQRAKSTQTCLQIIQELDRRDPKLSLHTLAPLIHLKQQLSSHESQKNNAKLVSQSKHAKLASQDIMPTQPIRRTKSAPNLGRHKKKQEKNLPVDRKKTTKNTRK